MAAPISLPVAFMRGGTSKALVFHARDLPPLHSDGQRAAWSDVFLRALGSPDPNGRQLNGMGGGLSSLSKVAVVGPATRADADVDYTFAQVGIGDTAVGYRGNCGNISAAIGPFAVDEGLIAPHKGRATVRIHNTNTGKIIVADFEVLDGRAAIEGDFAIQGVSGTGAPIRLAFQQPGGAATGRLFPTGEAVDRLDISGYPRLPVTLLDVSNPVVFVAATELGLRGDEAPADLAANASLIQTFEDIRSAAAVAMGLVPSEVEARTKLKNLPLVALLSRPSDESCDIVTRMVSTGQPHKATPLTGAMCLAAAVKLPGTIAHQLARISEPGADVRIAHASGILPVSATVRKQDNTFEVTEAVVYRTARRLMDGRVYLAPSH
ncbi:putative 3-methylitaconate isomerase [Hyphomicrobiales bacterium]|nr:putative 3-methylitaconate isomerase [Hyphomicrobiales bacterium]CAH1695429.1 putative 3-methylitaconate isomerase [Hyphomicrobiales bacterium]